MTVCIAAICDNGNTIIGVADRMLTAGGILEVEHDRPKIDVFDGKHVMMSAGDALVGTDIKADGLRQLPQGATDVSSSVGALERAYANTRRRVVDLRVLGAFCYTLDHFQQEGLKQLGPQMFAGILQRVEQFNLGADFIVAGFDGTTGRIAIIDNPGVFHWLDRVGFATIGSGSSHASTTLLAAGYSTKLPLKHALFEMYAAKRIAERAPGVGQQTDIVVLTHDQPMRWATPEALEALDKLHAEQMKSRGTVDASEVATKFKEAQ